MAPPQHAEELTLAYHRGLLVPFLGAGMSMNACPNWLQFVERLEKQAGIAAANSGPDLPSRAATAVRRLRQRGPKSFATAIRDALATGRVSIPQQTLNLAKLYWPLVLTTNYDNLFVTAANVAAKESARFDLTMRVAGRSRSDCRRVLRCLRQPDAPVLWALQGYVGHLDVDVGNESEDSSEHDDAFDRAHDDELERQLIVGHAEYRRVTLAEPHFRRAFAEVFRSRSVLFLGAGLQDKYLLDLFGEVIEMHGPSPHPHYAVMPKGAVPIDFMRDYYGIRVDEIDDKSERLPSWLENLSGLISKERITLRGREIASRGGDGRLTVVRGGLPRHVAEDECLVFSAGGSKKAKISGVGGSILDQTERSRNDFDWTPSEQGSLGRHRSDRRYWAVNARCNPWTQAGAFWRPRDPTQHPLTPGNAPTPRGRDLRDLRLIAPGMERLLDALANEPLRHVHMMLVSAGRGRTFPQSDAFSQMLRGWARWQDRNPDAKSPPLTLYVTADSVLHDLDSGRIDLATCMRHGQTQFWLDIKLGDGSEDPHLCIENNDILLLDFLRSYDLLDARCTLDLYPRPCTGWANWTIGAVQRWEEFHKDKGKRMTLEQFGVFEGRILTCVGP